MRPFLHVPGSHHILLLPLGLDPICCSSLAHHDFLPFLVLSCPVLSCLVLSFLLCLTFPFFTLISFSVVRLTHLQVLSFVSYAKF